MSHRQTRFERADEGSFPFCVAVKAEKCSGVNYGIQRDFCAVHKLQISKHGHSVIYENDWYCVFRFAKKEHADMFMKAFDGEPFHPAEKGRGKHWMQWKKGSYKPKRKGPYDFS